MKTFIFQHKHSDDMNEAVTVRSTNESDARIQLGKYLKTQGAWDSAYSYLCSEPVNGGSR